MERRVFDSVDLFFPGDRAEGYGNEERSEVARIKGCCASVACRVSSRLSGERGTSQLRRGILPG